MSLAMMLYNCVIKDHLSVLWEKYQIHKKWRNIGELREAAMTEKHMQNEHFYNENCCPLWELQIGASIQIHNQDAYLPSSVGENRENHGDTQKLTVTCVDG